MTTDLLFRLVFFMFFLGSVFILITGIREYRVAPRPDRRALGGLGAMGLVIILIGLALFTTNLFQFSLLCMGSIGLVGSIYDVTALKRRQSRFWMWYGAVKIVLLISAILFLLAVFSTKGTVSLIIICAFVTLLFVIPMILVLRRFDKRLDRRSAVLPQASRSRPQPKEAREEE